MPEGPLPLHHYLVRELKVVRKYGLHRLREHLDDLPALAALTERIGRGDGSAAAIEALLRSAWAARAEGAQGTAIGILLGLEVGRRGARPSVLREAAAKRLGYASVDTFRKAPEANAIDYFADVIESYCLDSAWEAKSVEMSGDRIEDALRAVKKLTLVEYAEFIRRLRAIQLFSRQEPGSNPDQPD